MIKKFQQTLPHDITLSCRAAGERGRPLLLFLHGFPEAAFVWDDLLEHFSGRYRCVALDHLGREQQLLAVARQARRHGHQQALTCGVLELPQLAVLALPNRHAEIARLGRERVDRER